jgi:hypothetical protein
MEHYSGFDAATELRVGQIRALRTFRVGPDGRLHSLFSPHAWDDGPNTADCASLRVLGGGAVSHPAPASSCTCGFYGYGTAAAAGEYPHAQHVLAVTSSWGLVIAGTRGLRAQHSQVEALWLSELVPADLRARIAGSYPSVAVYSDRDAMLDEHPVTALDCYQAPPSDDRDARARLFDIGAVLAIGLGPGCTRLLGAAQQDGAQHAGTGALVASGLGVVLAVALGRWHPRTVALPGRRYLLWPVVLWVLAPLLGTPGVLLLQVPMLAGGAMVLLARAQLVRSGRQFPADLG